MAFYIIIGFLCDVHSFNHGTFDARPNTLQWPLNVLSENSFLVKVGYLFTCVCYGSYISELGFMCLFRNSVYSLAKSISTPLSSGTSGIATSAKGSFVTLPIIHYQVIIQSCHSKLLASISKLHWHFCHLFKAFTYFWPGSAMFLLLVNM